MKILATVTEDEKNEIKKLVERKNSLIEVKSILNDNELISRQKRDKEIVEKDINEWWAIILKKYNLEHINNCHFINFENNCICSK
ncbi:MAG TPA: hypothetical protein DHU59_08820 [Clostridiales bacterium]|nr:hypothetical protein [Clostridiales bacterium]